MCCMCDRFTICLWKNGTVISRWLQNSLLDSRPRWILAFIICVPAQAIPEKCSSFVWYCRAPVISMSYSPTHLTPVKQSSKPMNRHLNTWVACRRRWCMIRTGSFRSMRILEPERFRSYVSQRCFKTYFCRAADPQSKGKVDNMVKYVKQNFLAGRSFKIWKPSIWKLMAGFHVPPMPLRMGLPKEYLPGKWKKR